MRTSQTHLPSLLGLILFVLSGLFMLALALFMGSTAFFSFVSGQRVEVQQTILFLAFGFEAALLFTAAFVSWQKTSEKPSADRAASLPIPFAGIGLLSLVAALAILIGNAIGATEAINWLLLPVLTIPAVVLPLLVILALGTRNLPFGTRWQTWSALGLGMTLTPIILFILEAVVAVVVFVGVIAYVVSKPELALEMQRLSQQILILGPQSEEGLRLLAPLMTRPGVMVTALLYIAFLVPAIEELFKPLGVWLLARRLDSPAQGFSLGALSGAAYGLIETIGVSGQGAEWASLLFSRIGTGLLHITTSALMGAAIVLAWRERRWLRLTGTYLLAILLHGLWNTFAVLFTFSTLSEFLAQPGLLSMRQPVLIAIMSMLAFGLFVIRLLTNRRMRRTISLTSTDYSMAGNSVDRSPET